MTVQDFDWLSCHASSSLSGYKGLCFLLSGDKLYGRLEGPRIQFFMLHQHDIEGL